MTENPIGGNELEVKIAALEAKLDTFIRAGVEAYSTNGPRTDISGGWGPRVRMGLIDAGRYMGEVLDSDGDAHGFPKLIGEPCLWATTTLPALSKWCDGTALSEDEYPELFDVLGSTYDTYRGQADPGAGMFRVPKYDGLVLVCFDSGDGDFNAVTDTGGSKDAIVVTHTHTDTFAISPDPHDHDVTTGTVQSGAGATVPTVTAGGVDTPDTSLSITGSVDSAGSSGTDANLQPYGVARYAIFAGR